MRLLVTGGAGFIGSVTVEQLLAREHDVVVFDNFSTGHRAALANPARFVEGDVSDRRLLIQVLHEKRIEAVIHLAANSDRNESFANPRKCFENNVSATLTLLDSMVEAGVTRLVFSSSTSVYGNPSELPVTEESACQPASPYAASKLAVEQLLPWYDQAFNLKYISLRYGTVSGASQRFGEGRESASRLIPQALSVAEGRILQLEVYGEDYPTPDGTCVRDYLHVLDVAEAHALSVSALERRSRVYNLSSGSGYTVHEVVEMAQQVTGRKIPTECGPRRAGDSAIMIPNADRIMSDLGWQPRNSELDRIIESSWRWRISHSRAQETSET
jgi:UDP-glucose 4-epimerase